MFSRWFGSAKTDDSATTAKVTGDAIQRLESVEETFLKKQEHLETLIQQEKGKALQLKRQGNNRGALNAMKKVKKYEKDLVQVDGFLTTIDNQREALHNAQSSKQAVDVIKLANVALKQAQGGMTADDVAELKDEMDELRTFSN